MKKLMIVLAGLVMSLYMMAYSVPQKVWTVSVPTSRYTCDYTQELKSTLSSDPFYVGIYEYKNGQLEELLFAWDKMDKKLTKTLTVGTYTFVVAAKDFQVINAPKRRMPAQTEATIPESLLNTITFDWDYPDQFDIYQVTVTYPVEEHEVNLEADVFTNKANFELYTTAGTVNPTNSRTFCGTGKYYAVVKGTSDNMSSFSYKNMNYDPSLVKETLTLTPGTYTYSVYTIDESKSTIQWCDRFKITVTGEATNDGYVYRYLDDVLFIHDPMDGATYQWYMDGEPIPGATGTIYTLPESADPSSTTTYSVIITLPNGETFIETPKTYYEFPEDDLGNCESRYVFTKWDDFMFVDNGIEGGNGTFVSYQWFRDNKAIQNANKQWYRTTLDGGELPSGKYHVMITDKDGNIIVTCPRSFEQLPRSEAGNSHGSVGAPKKQIINNQLIIEYDGRTYNAQGVEIK